MQQECSYSSFGGRCQPRAIAAAAVLFACSCAAVEHQHMGSARNAAVGTARKMKTAFHGCSDPARRPVRALRLRGGCASGSGEAGKGEEAGWGVDPDVEAVAGQVHSAINQLASCQERTQALVRKLAEDMMETHRMVQARLARLEGPGHDDSRRELQAVAAYLDGQIKLVKGSGVIDAPYADLIERGGAASASDQDVCTMQDHA